MSPPAWNAILVPSADQTGPRSSAPVMMSRLALHTVTDAISALYVEVKPAETTVSPLLAGVGFVLFSVRRRHKAFPPYVD